jgi:tetratricopeptide (TPR) repeat protein
MADSSLILSAKEKTGLHDYDAAQHLYRKYLEEDPTNAPVWILLGDVLTAQKNFYDAIDAYDSALSYDPDNPEYLVALGSAYAHIHQFSDAKILFEKAAKISGNLRHQYLVGDMLGYLGKYDEALVLYTLLSLSHPDEPGLYKRMATVHHHLNRDAEEKMCTGKELVLRKKVVDEHPDASAWFKYADVLFRCERYDEAKEAFLQALAFEENAQIHLRLGETLYKLNDTPGALEQFAEAAKFDPRDFAFLLQMADHLTNLGMYDASITYYTKALELRSVHADAWVGIAYNLLKLDRLEEANAFFEMAKASAAIRELPWADKLHKSQKTAALDAAFPPSP